MPGRPACLASADLGWPWLRAASASLAIDAETAACGWDGRTVDYGACVAHLVAADGLS